MSIKSLVQVGNIVDKLYDVIVSVDNSFDVQLYTTEIKLKRGQVSFNIIPMNITTRAFSGENTLPDITIAITMHYELEAKESYNEVWKKHLKLADDLLQKFYARENYVNGVSTVDIDVEFDNSDIDNNRMVVVLFECMYKIFSTR